jgi:hypothetical protein
MSLANSKGAKGYIVVFTCNTCPYAKAYETRINRATREICSAGLPRRGH